MCCRSSTSSTFVDKCLVRNIEKQNDKPCILRGHVNKIIKLKLLRNVISDYLAYLPLSDPWNACFRHNGVRRHKVSSVQQLIRDSFQQQILAYGGCIKWHPRSSDLNTLGFFSVGTHQTANVCSPSTNIAETGLRMLAPTCHLLCWTMCPDTMSHLTISHGELSVVGWLFGCWY